MRIAIFTDTFYPDLNGVTVSIDNFSKELERQGHLVYIFAPKFRGHKDKNPNIYRISSFKVLSSEPEIRFPIPISRHYLREVFRKEFDIVHAHGNGPFSLLGYQVARMKGIPFVLTFHTLHTKYTHYILNGKVVKPRMVAAGLRMFANLCDGVITPSLKMKKELNSYGVKKQIKIVPNFVTFENFQVKNSHYLHNLLSIPTTSPILLSVGRLGKEKNFEFLIKTFKKVSKVHPHAHLVLVGKGREKKNLLRLSRKLRIGPKVHIAGPIPPEKMPYVYKDSALFVFASKTETQGICVLEATCSGLPIVVAHDLAYEPMVKNGKNGFLLPLTQKEFINKLNLILKDNKLREKMSKQSLLLGKENTKMELITNDLVEFYEKIIVKHGETGQRIRTLNKVAVRRIVQTKNTLQKLRKQLFIS